MEAAQDRGNQARNSCVGKARKQLGRVLSECLLCSAAWQSLMLCFDSCSKFSLEEVCNGEIEAVCN